MKTKPSLTQEDDLLLAIESLRAKREHLILCKRRDTAMKQARREAEMRAETEKLVSRLMANAKLPRTRKVKP